MIDHSKGFLPLYTCPKEAAAMGSGLIWENSWAIGAPNWDSMDFIATRVENGGIWS